MADTENNITQNGIPQISMTVSPSQNVMTPTDPTLSIAEMAADAKATGEAISDLGADISDLNDAVTNIQQTAAMLADIFPVGAMYMTTLETLPSVLTALGTWEEVYLPLKWGDIRNGTRSFVPRTELEDDVEPGTVRIWIRTS